MEDNCYELLGVSKEAGGLMIKRSYRKLASEWCAAAQRCAHGVVRRLTAERPVSAQAPRQEPGPARQDALPKVRQRVRGARSAQA